MVVRDPYTKNDRQVFKLLPTQSMRGLIEMRTFLSIRETYGWNKNAEGDTSRQYAVGISPN